MSVRIAAALVATALPLAALAQDAWKQPHIPEAKEHRIVKFYPDSSVYEYSNTEFDAVDFITGYDRKAEQPVAASLEGRIIRYNSHHKPGTSALQVVRNYENALKKAGLTTLYAGKGTQLGNMPLNSEEAMGGFRLDTKGKPSLYIMVKAYPNGDEPWSEVLIVEPKAMEQVLEANADAWFEEISKSGRVAVYGINFDTGKATLRADSAPVLEEVRKLAAAHPGLKLRIEGHTDNAGNAAANRKLSEERAGAVKAWLVGKGVKASQLSTAGLGDTRPVADNGSDDGRAKNRRVELARQ
jgi:outer membrane protein OmpA-like peptidoglycan-associated protein